MVRTETSVFTVDSSTTHPDCSTMITDRCLNTSRQTDPSPATDQGRHWLPGRLACYMLAVLAALSVLPVAAQDQDTTAPELRSVSINRVGLRLTYDEELDDDSEPDNSAFTVTVNGASREVRTVVVIRTFVLVFLYSPVQAGETVTVSYTVPATNPVQDLSGNRAAAITNLPVSNNTPATAPPAPTNLTAQAGDRSVTLTWTTSGNGGSAITKHQYREKIESGEFGNWMNIPNSAEGQANANSYTVPNRTNGTTYTYKVRAVNAQGESTESNEDSARPTATVTSTAPPAPTNLTAQAGDRSVTLTWTTPGNGGSTITKHQYREKIESGEFGNWMNIPNSAEGQANANSYTVPDLTNGITYTFEVRAANAQGESTESNEDSARPATVPDAPTNLTAQAGDRSVTLTWTTPGNGGSAITKHQYREKVGTGAFGNWTNIPNSAEGQANANSYTVSDLTNGIIYTFEVRAVNAQGQSTESNEDSARPILSSYPPLSVSPIAYKTVEQGKLITPIHLSASGGWEPYTYSISGAPSSISLSSGNRITGSPSQDGTFPITVTVTDDNGNTADHSFDMSVYSIELAKLFSPILILTKNLTQPDRKVIFPEPVEIMGANSVSNLWFSLHTITGQFLESFQYPASGWSSDLRSDYQSQFFDINFSENKFASLPEVLNYIGRPPGDYATGAYRVTAHFEYPGNGDRDDESEGKDSWYDYYNSTTHPKRGDHPDFPHTAYVHIFDEGGQVVIQYYYFYPFNDFQNDHEGDWPHVNVLVTSYDPDDADLVGIDYKFHGKGMNYTSMGGRTFNPRIDFAPAEGGTHPVIYVGAGSHGSFPTGGNYPDAGEIILGEGVAEDMTTDGIILSTDVEDTNPDVAEPYDLILLPNPDPDQPNKGLSPEMSWLGTGALWGTVNAPSSVGNKAADGPLHSGWGSWGASGYDKVNVPYTEFQQFPIVQDVSWSGTIKLIGDIVVYPGATLTIDAGTTIKASPNRDVHDMEDPNRVDIINYGRIRANGTSSQPVVFRSDTSTPSAGDWYGIRNHGDLTMSHCTIQHAVIGLYLYGTHTLTDMTVVDNTWNNTSPLTITAIEDVTATQNVAITNISLSASGGWEPYTYSTSDLPSGIVLDQNQNRVFITGTPTVTAYSDITVTVRDAVGGEASTTFNLSVSAPARPLSIEPIADVIATQNVAITPIQVVASGGSGSYTYSIESNPEGLIASDPADEDSGLTIDPNSGQIRGTPTASGNFRITVTVEDAPPGRAPPTQESHYFSMTVNAPTHVTPPLTIAEIDDIAIKISGVQTNSPITPIQVSASGGQTPYTYSLSSNPATGSGLSINASNGQITGTPTQRGTFTLTVTVTDNASTTATESFSMAVRLIADFNDDGVVNISDHLLFLEVFGLTEDDDGFNAEMDLNGDGTIGIPDFLIFVDNFGSSARFF